MTSLSMPLITLTTDFGLRDPYVAAMKGVMYGISRELCVVDLSHEIPPQDVLDGALFLAGALPYFPKGTIHVVVVDPGVGTDRRPIALSAGDQILICPDNGLPTLFLREHPLQEARVITNRRLIRETVSPTFHGRDVFAPAAAHLACGAPMEQLGKETDTIVTLDLPRPRKEGGRLEGEILHTDRFGNLVTNIHQSMLAEATPSVVRAGRHRLGCICQTYAEVSPGSPVALFGSTGYLEIAVNGGSAHAALHLRKGDPVSIEFPLPT